MTCSMLAMALNAEKRPGFERVEGQPIQKAEPAQDGLMAFANPIRQGNTHNINSIGN